jgi:hypothetical protein
MPTRLNHDDGDAGFVDILEWTHIRMWMYARQYLWVRLAINVGGKSFLQKNQNSDGRIC